MPVGAVQDEKIKGGTLMWKIGIAILLGLFNGNPNISLYATTFVVTETRETNDLVILTDLTSGHQYAFTGIEDWERGNVVACVMSDNGTTNIYDDQILTVKYDGWIDLGEELTGYVEAN